jgi:hypothetical protein
MSEFDHQDGVGRRKVLESMSWRGTGVLWTIAAGVPRSLGIMGEAQAAEVRGLTLLQISDSHVGPDKPANPHALGAPEEAIAKISPLPQKPAFMIHTGDISHLSEEKEFDNADQIISQSRVDVQLRPPREVFDVRHTPGEPEVLLKTGTKTIVLELGHEGKFSARAQGWDENQVIKSGEKIELSVVHGQWLIVKMQPAGHSPGKAG